MERLMIEITTESIVENMWARDWTPSNMQLGVFSKSRDLFRRVICTRSDLQKAANLESRSRRQDL